MQVCLNLTREVMRLWRCGEATGWRVGRVGRAWAQLVIAGTVVGLAVVLKRPAVRALGARGWAIALGC